MRRSRGSRGAVGHGYEGTGALARAVATSRCQGIEAVRHTTCGARVGT